MKPLRIADAPSIILGLQDEIQRSEESRYDHRLHAVLLVAQGVTCPAVADLLGASRRSVEYWVHAFENEGLAGLREGERPGRPSRLSERQLAQVSAVLRLPPRDAGMTAQLWDGRLLARYLRGEFGVELGVRQCQRLFRQLGFRLRKPRPLIAHADPMLQSAVKKTAKAGPRSRR
jgi:transposase